MALQLYAVLGLTRDASAGEVKRAYRTLSQQAHPDKGGSADAFAALTEAFNVLSNPAKRAHYDATGEVQQSPTEAFVASFAGGSFADRPRRSTAAAAAALAPSVADQISVRQAAQASSSHTAGFEAWLRSRGEGAGSSSGAAAVYTADTIADKFGVVSGSYAAVPLAPRSVVTAVCKGPGAPLQQLQLTTQDLPLELEWGQVLIDIQLAPITPADIYSMRLGGLYGDNQAVEPPFVAGHECVAIVAQVGPGVKGLQEGDVVLPTVPLLGTYRQAAVVKAKQLVRVGVLAGSSGGATDVDNLPLPLQYLAVYRELALAYKLLEGDGGLKPGDAIILNAPNSIVGRTLLQLAKLLKLRAVAVLRGSAAGAAGDAKFAAVAEQLKALGATLVVKDQGSVRAQLAQEPMFARPKLALDAVGGDSAARLADTLAQGGRLVVYGCLSGKAPVWPWQAWVFRGLQVSGFNIRAVLAADTSRGAAQLREMLTALGKLVVAGHLSHTFTEYRVGDGSDGKEELQEALQHAMDAPGGSRVLLRMPPDS